MAALDRQQTLGIGLGFRDVIGAQQWIERAIRRETLERNLRLVLEAAGEDRQTESLAQPFEQSRLRKPLLSLDQAAAIFADENLVEVVDDGVVRNFDAQVRGD